MNKPFLSSVNWQALNQRLFPCQCKICHQASKELVCEQCLDEMLPPGNACLQCAEKLPDELQATRTLTICGQCTSQAPAFERTIAAYRYQGHAATLIQQFKFREDLMLSKFFAERLFWQISRQLATAELPDALIPIPLHPKRLKQRGFNQSHEVAKQLGRLLNIPVYKNALNRHRPTPEQSGLNRLARARNIKGAFHVNQADNANIIKLQNKHLAIVDDVITTGSTIREAARKLRQTQAGRISIFAIAKTQQNRDIR